MDWDRVARERNLGLPGARDDQAPTKPLTLKRLTSLLRNLGTRDPNHRTEHMLSACCVFCRALCRGNVEWTRSN